MHDPGILGHALELVGSLTVFTLSLLVGVRVLAHLYAELLREERLKEGEA